MKTYCMIRSDLTAEPDNITFPALLKGWPETLMDAINTGEQFKFRYEDLKQTETAEGFNLVIWLKDDDFVDIANSIDFDFIGGSN